MPSVWKRGAFWNSEEEKASRDKCRVSRSIILCMKLERHRRCMIQKMMLHNYRTVSRG